MEFFDVINNRHMYRGAFSTEKVPQTDIKKIIDAAIKAPVGVNENSTTYLVVQDPELISKIGKLYPKNGVGTAPCLIVVLSEKVETWVGAFEMENYVCAATQLLLAATALGYSSLFTHGQTHNPEVNAALRKLLPVPENKTIRAVLPIGKELEHPCQAERPAFDSVVQFI